MTAIPAQPLLAAAPVREGTSPRLFVAACLAVAILAASLAGFVPIGFSIVTVFLFAGPHNWLEFRYFLAKMPAHWGPLKPFFSLAVGGVLVLAAGFGAMALLGRSLDWDREQWQLASASWNSVLIAWVAVLAWMRGKQSPQRDWFWALPAGCGLIAVIWLFPIAWEIGLIYLHPLIALIFLDREIARRKPAWRGTYHACLAAIPVCLAVLWWRLADAPPLAGGNDMLTMRITNHAGADVLQNLSPHLLVATHTFLEMLHYGVWVVAIPLLAMKAAPWKFTAVPLARRSVSWRRGVVALLACGVIVVVALWASFLGNYAITRDVYFTIAIAHVLAEFPFLLKGAVTNYLWHFLLPGYLTTIAIETIVLLIGLSPPHPIRRRIFAGIWLTACTYPIVVLVLPILLEERWLYLLVAETFAPVAECTLFSSAFHSNIRRADRIRDLLVIALANLASFGIGILLESFFRGILGT